MSGATTSARRIQQAADGKARSGTVVACAGCTVPFYSYPSEAKRFCSPGCRRKRERRSCLVCGAEFEAKLAHRKKTCGSDCAGALKSLAAAARWKDDATREKAVSGLSRAAKADPGRAAQLDRARARHVFSEATREKIRAARLKQRFPVRATLIERLLGAALSEIGIQYREQVAMFGRWQPDFVIDSARLAVQADGIYWHSSAQAKANDAAFDAAARAAGWEVLRFTDQQIMTDAAQCARSVANSIAERIA